MKQYYQTIEFLEGFVNVREQKDYMQDQSHPELYLKRMRYFLGLINNPHKKNFKYIHIAGTSGKGSVVAMLHQAIGKNVGSFMSPFVTTSIEKIKVGNKYISPKELADIVNYIKPYIDQAYLKSPYGGPSYFEIWMAIVFVYFARKKCKWVILETGCGGRYDATNVIEKPVVTAVTNIDFDHTRLLGKSLKKIAFEKAGIMKKGCPFFTAEQRSHLLKVFEKVAKQKGAKYKNPISEKSNKALVEEIVKYLKLPKSVKPVRLPCRFETIQTKPLVILDGAHCVAKIKNTVENLEKVKYKKLILVLAITASKDIQGMCKLIAPLADYVFATRYSMPFRKCTSPKELVKICKKGKMYMDPDQALNAALKKANVNDLILVTGSFFLAGELRKRWYPEERILKTLKSF